MPVSHYRHINAIMSRIDRLWDSKKFNSILDIGVGFGKYGVLLRERYDVRFKRCKHSQWDIRIDGSEIYDDYLLPHIQYIYDRIYLGDICNTINGMHSYDVILMLEVLEHISKEKGIELIRSIKNLTNSLLIVSFPRSLKGDEGSDWPNTYERHLCLWTKDELMNEIGLVETLSPTIFAQEM